MAIALVAGQVATANGSATSVNVVLPNNPTTGNLVVVIVGWDAASGPGTVTVKDNGTPNSTYAATTSTPANLTSFASNGWMGIYYLQNVPATATKTITVSTTSSVTSVNVWAAEFSGAATSSVFDKDATGGSTTATNSFVLPSITPTGNNELLVGQAQGASSFTTITAGSPWTGISTSQITARPGYSEFVVQTTGGAQAIAFTTTGTARAYCGMSAAFNPAGAVTINTGWMENRDQPFITKPRYTDPEPYALPPPVIPPRVFVSATQDALFYDNVNENAVAAFLPALPPPVPTIVATSWFNLSQDALFYDNVNENAAPARSPSLIVTVQLFTGAWYPPWDMPVYSKPKFTDPEPWTLTRPPIQFTGAWFPPWDQPFYTRPRFTDPSAFPLGRPIVAITGIGWFQPWDQPLFARPKFTDMSAYQEMPPPTLFTGAWFSPWDMPVYGKPKFTDMSAYQEMPPPTGVAVSGIGWFEPWDLPFISRPKFMDPQPYALPAPVVVTVGIGWFEPWDQPNYTRARFTDPPSFMPPSPAVPISGVGWFNPWDQPFYVKPRYTDPSTFPLQSPPVPLAGIPWFEPWDQPNITRARFTDPQPYSLPPPVRYSIGWFQPWDLPFITKPRFTDIASFCPVVTFTPVAGMSWFEPWDQPVYGKPRFTDPSPYLPNIPSVAIAGIGWFNPWDQPIYSKPRYTDPCTFTIPAVVAAVSGMAWFEPWDLPTITRPRFTDPMTFPLTAAPTVNTIAGMAWFEPWDQPFYVKPRFSEAAAYPLHQPFVVGIGWFQPWEYWPWLFSRPRFTDPPAGVAQPPFVIPGMAWFQPWDMPRYGTQVHIEAAVAVTLFPPPPTTPVSGMAWAIASDTFLPKRTPSFTDIAAAWCPQVIVTVTPGVTQLLKPNPFGGFTNFGRAGSTGNT